MNTTREYLIEVKKKNNLSSDYALAKLLGTTRSAISFYMKGERIMDDTTCLKVAEALNLNPLEIIARANAERARTDEEAKQWIHWQKEARKMSVIALIVMGILSQITPISANVIGKNSTYYVKLSQAPGFDRLPLSSRLQNA